MNRIDVFICASKKKKLSKLPTAIDRRHSSKFAHVEFAQNLEKQHYSLISIDVQLKYFYLVHSLFMSLL